MFIYIVYIKLVHLRPMGHVQPKMALNGFTNL